MTVPRLHQELHRYTWVPTGEKVLFPCPVCGAQLEHLRVEPDRSPKYLRQIAFCSECKHIVL